MEYRGTYLQVNLDAIANNAAMLRAFIGKDSKMMAVVKANAYGHGLIPVARTALENGADWLGVAIPEEGEALRNAGIDAPILVLGGVNEKGAEASVAFDLTQTVFDAKRVYFLEQAAKKAGKTAHVHIKCDTGMGRIGVRTKEELEEVLAAVRSCPHVCITGVFTHLADADNEDPAYSLAQIAAFEEFLPLLPSSILCHAAASAAAIRYPQARYQMVRLGLILYGCPPVKDCPPVQPALSWHTEIVHVKDIGPGDCISYGCTYRADRKRRVATLPVGYGDGYHRALSGRGMVLIGGKKCPVIGRVCMDQIMVDVSDVSPEAAGIGAPAVLLGRQEDEMITAEELAAWAGTISYEMLLAVTARVPMIYTAQKAVQHPKGSYYAGND